MTISKKIKKEFYNSNSPCKTIVIKSKKIFYYTKQEGICCFKHNKKILNGKTESGLIYFLDINNNYFRFDRITKKIAKTKKNNKGKHRKEEY